MRTVETTCHVWQEVAKIERKVARNKKARQMAAPPPVYTPSKSGIHEHDFGEAVPANDEGMWERRCKSCHLLDRYEVL